MEEGRRNLPGTPRTTRRAWVEWLYGELPSLEAEGFLAPGGAEGIKRRYGIGEKKPAVGAVLVVFAVLGALCIGLGAILLFARNWAELGRPERLALALLPLAASIALCLFAFLKRPSSAPWREAAAVFNLLAVGAALALIGQTYHMAGGLDGLLFAWLILALPMVYLLSSLGSWTLWLVGASVWACAAQSEGGNAAFYWIFLLAAMPEFLRDLLRDPLGQAAALRGWALILSLSVCLGVSLEKVMPGLWIIIYPGFFSVLASLDILWLEDLQGPDGRSAFAAPFRSAGFLGLLSLAFILSYGWPWEDIGWRNWRGGARFVQSLAWLDILIAGAFLASPLVLSVLAAVKRKFRRFALGLLPLVAAAGYLVISSLSRGEGGYGDAAPLALGIVNLLMNAFILYAGVLMIVSGARSRKAAELNLGAAVVALLVILRFVFSERFMESLFSRGLAFIAIGAFFLGMNLLIARRFRSAGEAGK